MTTNLAKSASNNRQIIESWLPNDRRAKFLPSVVGDVYNWLRVGGHLGNVGLKLREGRAVRIEWVKGHSGDLHNELVDKLARDEALRAQSEATDT